MYRITHKNILLCAQQVQLLRYEYNRAAVENKSNKGKTGKNNQLIFLFKLTHWIFIVIHRTKVKRNVFYVVACAMWCYVRECLCAMPIREQIQLKLILFVVIFLFTVSVLCCIIYTVHSNCGFRLPSLFSKYVGNEFAAFLYLFLHLFFVNLFRSN